MPELVTLGETMAAFSPAGPGPLRYISDYRLRIAGAESNLAIGLEKLGHSARWLSRLGEDEFGRYVLSFVRGEGVDTSGVRMDKEHRTGVMFKQLGPGETKVFYYRENAAASYFSPEDLCAESFSGARILHLTGITPVLSESCMRACRKAMELAEEKGMLLSFDPNIRKKLWGDRGYRDTLREMSLRADILLLGLTEAQELFGLSDPDELFDLLFQKGNVRFAAIKNGAAGCWAADRTIRGQLPPFPCRCVDPIGAGDAFNAGFLAGMLEGRGVLDCARMGNIAGALATQTVGDVEGYPCAEEMRRLLAGAPEAACR